MCNKSDWVRITITLKQFCAPLLYIYSFCVCFLISSFIYLRCGKEGDGMSVCMRGRNERGNRPKNNRRRFLLYIL